LTPKPLSSSNRLSDPFQKAMTMPAEMHKHDHAAPAARHDPGFSLLRLSAAQRLGIVLVALALLWGGVYWALS
jgi:hypothetical protein